MKNRVCLCRFVYQFHGTGRLQFLEHAVAGRGRPLVAPGPLHGNALDVRETFRGLRDERIFEDYDREKNKYKDRDASPEAKQITRIDVHVRCA